MTVSPFLPVLDLGWLDQGREQDFADGLRQAFVSSGFCYLANHGMPSGVIEAVRTQALRFFHLPLAEKLKVRPREGVRGFNAIGRTRMRYADAPDHKEYYQMGLELAPDDPGVLAGQPMRGPNQWPDLPGFREAFEAYYAAIGLCGQRLLTGVARALDAPDHFFADKYDKPLARTQAVWYPPHPGEHSGELFGVAPHTDYGCVTLLWQDDIGGLEVLDPSGSWIAAPPIADTLVVNIGDLLQRWSNDRFRSNRHRVTNRSGRERLSIATFYDPDFLAPVDPRDLLPAGAFAHHPPLLAGDYIIGRITASLAHNTAE